MISWTRSGLLNYSVNLLKEMKKILLVRIVQPSHNRSPFKWGIQTFETRSWVLTFLRAGNLVQMVLHVLNLIHDFLLYRSPLAFQFDHVVDRLSDYLVMYTWRLVEKVDRCSYEKTVLQHPCEAIDKHVDLKKGSWRQPILHLEKRKGVDCLFDRFQEWTVLENVVF